MAHREFQDSAGLRWAVWDVYPSLSVDGGKPGRLLGEDASEGWLTFQCPSERRRFYMPPEEWETFTDEQPALLSRHAVPVPPAR